MSDATREDLDLPGADRPRRRHVVHRRERTGPDREIVAAAGLTLGWFAGAAGLLLLLPRGEGGLSSGLAVLALLVALATPVALIWLAACVARMARLLREDRARLEALAARMRRVLEQGGARAEAGVEDVTATLAPKLDEIARAQRQTEAALTRLTGQGGPTPPTFRAHPRAAPRPRTAPPPAAARPAPEPAPPGTTAAPTAPASQPDQPALGLETPAAARGAPIGPEIFIQALNFPETETDAAGFDALRAALRDPFAAALVRSAQDVLTLLSEDGIYMDDLAPDRARPDLWRRFAQGERGRGVAPLGGIRDRETLALTAGRMRQDPVFRDVAHHFLRKFDRTFAAFEPEATDAEIAALSETRTARAFMLLGRVAGTFD